MDLLDGIKLKAKSHNKRIVLPEGLEERTLKAGR
jgi:phosphotransacetylase